MTDSRFTRYDLVNEPGTLHSALFREARLRRDLSQIDVDERTGYSRGSTSRFETRGHNVPIAKVVRMFEAIGLQLAVVDGDDVTLLPASEYPKSKRGREDIGLDSSNGK